GLRVLAVDDNETFLRIISEMLDRFGFRVTTAVSGEEAEMLLTGENEVVVDLILMDWNLPGASGIETIHHLRRKLELETLPAIILMTAYGDSELEDSDNGLPLLLKPFTGSTLLDMIVNIFCGTDRPGVVKGASRGRSPSGIAGCRILVAEDNHLNLQVVRELLQSWGVLVDTAGDGAEALDMIQKKEYDLALLDIQMPEMDGLTATRKIRAMGGRYQKMPILAMTAHVFSADRQKSLAAGMNGHVTKPLDPDALRQTLSRWLKDNSEEKAANTAVKIDECPAILDCEAALRRLAGNIDLYWQLLGEFCRDNKNKAAEIELALVQDDWHKAHRLTHTLKGVSGNLGAMAVHNAAIRLEQAILGHAADYRNLLVEIAEHLEALSVSVERLIGGKEVVAAELTASNKADMNKDLRELLRLVQLHDIDAESLFTKLAPVLAEMFPPATEDLGHKITNLDFTAAKRLLTELMANMEVIP
ncbi:MAG: response regulator, partial [Deltaproteobacteria bacterium]|nr:response regulator [Deltaproteobacteria bacterium]